MAKDDEEVDHKMLLDRLHIGVALARWCLGGLVALAIAIAGSFVTTRDDVREATVRIAHDEAAIDALKQTDKQVSATLWEINSTVGRIAGALGVTHDAKKNGNGNGNVE